MDRVAPQSDQPQNAYFCNLNDLKPYWGGAVYTTFVAAYFFIQETPIKEYSWVPIVAGAPFMSLATRYFTKFFSEGTVTQALDTLGQAEKTELEKLRRMDSILQANHKELHSIVSEVASGEGKMGELTDQIDLLDTKMIEENEKVDQMSKDLESGQIFNKNNPIAIDLEKTAIEEENKNREILKFLGEENV